MVRWLISSLLVLLSLSVYADVNSDIQQCLGGQGKQGQSKSQCVTSAIDNAVKNKQAEANGVYSRFEAQNIASDSAGGGAGMQGGEPQPSVGPVAPPSPAQPSRPAAPPPVPASPSAPPATQPQTPSKSGGVQFY